MGLKEKLHRQDHPDKGHPTQSSLRCQYQCPSQAHLWGQYNVKSWTDHAFLHYVLDVNPSA